MGDFLRHLLLRPMGVQKAVSAEQRSSRLPAPLARYRPEYPFPSCVPAELESVFPGTYESTTFQRLLPNHWTQERMPAKIHRPVPRSKDRNRTSPLPLKSKKYIAEKMASIRLLQCCVINDRSDDRSLLVMEGIGGMPSIRF